MNCVELFSKRANAAPKQMALWLPSTGALPFDELLTLCRRAQSLCLSYGLQAGDRVLFAGSLDSSLYALVLGIMGLGASVVLVEPWMPMEHIRHVVNLAQPKIFFAGTFGKLWGMRVAEIRKIPHWVSTGKVFRQSASAPFHIESVDGEAPGIITFTSGTTGKPKGVVRSQRYLIDQHEVVSQSLAVDSLPGSDLCIFANLALANLGSGRGSVIIPARWTEKVLAQVDALPANLQPDSMACGPAFLLELIRKNVRLAKMKSIHVGGALTDRWIFEESFNRWPEAHVTHTYGSSEAEPVALSDAKKSVALSRERGFFQTLHLGQPISEITPAIEKDAAWVTGRHVSPAYLGNDSENLIHKRIDPQGRVWHCMGDRVEADAVGWWYMGRSSQSLADFKLEQAIYTYLQSSSSFVHRDAEGRLVLLGEKLDGKRAEIKANFPEIESIFQLEIVRDRRHRARIDRAKSLKKGTQWKAP